MPTKGDVMLSSQCGVKGNTLAERRKKNSRSCSSATWKGGLGHRLGRMSYLPANSL